MSRSEGPLNRKYLASNDFFMTHFEVFCKIWFMLILTVEFVKCKTYYKDHTISVFQFVKVSYVILINHGTLAKIKIENMNQINVPRKAF